MKPQISKRLLSLTLLLLLWGGCSYDHGIEPVLSRVKGTIIFEGVLPDYSVVREARIVFAKKIPPENFTTDVILSDPLPFNRAASRTEPDTVQYEVAVDPGVYAVTGILWRRQGQAWNIANLIGLYGVDFNRFEFAPKEIVIPDVRAVADSVDIRAYWDFANRDATATGKIDFAGEWRSDTDFFVLGFYSEIPRQQFEYLSFKSFQFILQRTPVLSYSYLAPVSSGKYKFIALFWKGKTSSLADIRAIGIYRCPNDTTRVLPNSIDVSPAATVSGIDFVADFSTLPAGVRFSVIEKCGQP
jgi:hypothetical protein